METFDIHLGNFDNWGDRSLGLFRGDRRRHCYIHGSTGTGKSTLLRSMIVQDMHNGEGVGLIDPHGSLADEVLASVPKERIGDVIVVDPTDPERAIGINPLFYPLSDSSSLSQDNRERRAASVHAALKGIYSDSWGAELDRVLMASLLALIDVPELHPTLISVLRLIDDAKYRNYVRTKIKNRAAWLYFNQTLKEYRAALHSQKTASTSNKIFQIVASTQLANVFGQYVPSFNLKRMMDEKKIIIVRIPQGKMGQIYSSLFGAIMANEFYQAAIERGIASDPDLDPKRVDEYEISDFYLFIDEFQKIQSAGSDDVFSEARKYRLNLTIGHQYLTQLPSNTLDAVLGNAGTTISFRPSPKDARTLSEYYGEFSPTAYTSLGTGEVIASCLRNGQPQQPVICRTVDLPIYSKRRAHLICNVSSNTYGRDRKKIEAQLDLELGLHDLEPEKLAQKKRYAATNSKKKSIRDMVKKLAKEKNVNKH